MQESVDWFACQSTQGIRARIRRRTAMAGVTSWAGLEQCSQELLVSLQLWSVWKALQFQVRWTQKWALKFRMYWLYSLYRSEAASWTWHLWLIFYNLHELSIISNVFDFRQVLFPNNLKHPKIIRTLISHTARLMSSTSIRYLIFEISKSKMQQFTINGN